MRVKLLLSLAIEIGSALKYKARKFVVFRDQIAILFRLNKAADDK